MSVNVHKTTMFKYGVKGFTFSQYDEQAKELKFFHFNPWPESKIHGLSVDVSGFDWNNF